ncbi:MAG: coniferyl aldehyde dehydrogenase [Rhodobacteraceae bacterium]|nr:coniferyl aldehyde dehydrogenase [Paracoccaceae bacterium]
MTGSQHPELSESFRRLHKASRDDPYPELSKRQDQLRRVEKMTLEHEKRIKDAISADFSHRSPIETEIADTMTTVLAARHARRHVKSWMRYRRAGTALHFLPLQNKIFPQPLGVIGIIAPWNYPYNLAMVPLIAALAAGNRALIKPSEVTPATSALITELIAANFDPSEVAIVEGDADLSRAFSQLPFDHLFFTGSGTVGRLIAIEAAKNLTPVTLELGGKSPAIVHRSADLDQAVPHLAFGKWLNAGQSCIAPDYALVPKDMIPAFTEKLTAQCRKMYPELGSDYSAVVTQGSFDRLQGLLDDARNRGAKIIVPVPDATTRKLPPALVLNPPPECTLMQEEIFGPILPILPCETTDDAIAFVKANDRPLTLYWFGRDRASEARIRHELHAGSMVVNDTMVQFAQESLPFGGIGPSGYGSYHGKAGFDRFSHFKSICRRPGLPDPTQLLHAPYGKTTRRLLNLIRRIG